MEKEELEKIKKDAEFWHRVGGHAKINLEIPQVLVEYHNGHYLITYTETGVIIEHF